MAPVLASDDHDALSARSLPYRDLPPPRSRRAPRTHPGGRQLRGACRRDGTADSAAPRRWSGPQGDRLLSRRAPGQTLAARHARRTSLLRQRHRPRDSEPGRGPSNRPLPVLRSDRRRLSGPRCVGERHRRAAAGVGFQYARRLVGRRSREADAVHGAARHGGRRRLVRARVQGSCGGDRSQRSGAAARRPQPRRLVHGQRVALGARLASADVSARRLPRTARRQPGPTRRRPLRRPSGAVPTGAGGALFPRHQGRNPRSGSRTI